MTLSQLSSREAVLRAIAEFDALGAPDFLERHRFGPSRRYLLVHEGRTYDSKALAGVAHGYQFPDLGPLRSDEFSGGLAGAAGKLRTLGFSVIDRDGSDSHGGGPTPLADPHVPRLAPNRGARRQATDGPDLSPDVILLGCVKGKLAVASPARDLYTSDLFRKRKAYADRHSCPWFILSAQHGLVAPAQILEPYDLALKDQSSRYRHTWSERVIDRLRQEVGSLNGKVIEVHAGAPYVEALRAPLMRSGGVLSTPLSGLALGQQLAWYIGQGRPARVTIREASEDDVRRAISVLGNTGESCSPSDFPWGRTDLDSAGLYSWWINGVGAEAISSALGVEVREGLVYAGQAGATSWPSGKRSSATVLSRVAGNHLRGRVTASTWRFALAATLDDSLGLEIDGGTLDPPSQDRLTAWMANHLRLAVHPVENRQILGDLESRLLAVLDPPMNIKGMPTSLVRSALGIRRRLLRQRLADGPPGT